MRQKRSARQSHDHVGQSGLVLEDMADCLEEFRLKGRRVENLADRIVVVVVGFAAVLRDEDAEMKILAENQFRQRTSFRVVVLARDEGHERRRSETRRAAEGTSAAAVGVVKRAERAPVPHFI